MLREIKTILAHAQTPSFGTCALAWANESSRLYVEINLGILGNYSIRGIFIRLHFATLATKAVYSVAGGALFVCLERELTLELIRAMAERKPERVVCLDEGFAGNDQLKANAVQIFKTKGVTSFKTV